MNETDRKPITAPDLRAQFLPPLDRIAAVIEVPEGGTLEATRADFARMLQLVGLANELVDELAEVANASKATWKEQALRQLVLLAAFAEIAAGGQVETHAPMRRYLAELEQRLKAGP